MNALLPVYFQVVPEIADLGNDPPGSFSSRVLFESGLMVSVVP
jgi:hypothetical protein